MLDLEVDLHAELGALFDCERLLLKFLDGAGGLQVNDDVVSAFNLETQ